MIELTSKQLELTSEVLRQFVVEGECVWVFGSRIKGTAKLGLT